MDTCFFFTFFAFLCCSFGLPDLIVDRESMLDSSYFETRYFPEEHCEVIEGCISSPGLRRIFRFDANVANIGTSDLSFGNPEEHPDIFEYHDCHEHYHFNDWMIFAILNPDDLSFVKEGGKQGFCLLDDAIYDKYSGDPSLVNQNWTHDCDNQGISVGWYDSYSAGLPCQYIDITDLEAGSYILEAYVNPYLIVEESNYDNNKVYIPLLWNGDNGLSDYKPNKRDLKYFSRKVSNLNTNNDLLNIADAFCLQFETMVIGINLCIYSDNSNVTENDKLEALYWWNLNNLDKLEIQTFVIKKTFDSNNGYFVIDSISLFKNSVNCTLIQNTYNVVYYNENGNINKYDFGLSQEDETLFVNFVHSNNSSCLYSDEELDFLIDDSKGKGNMGKGKGKGKGGD